MSISPSIRTSRSGYFWRIAKLASLVLLLSLPFVIWVLGVFLNPKFAVTTHYHEEDKAWYYCYQQVKKIQDYLSRPHFPPKSPTELTAVIISPVEIELRWKDNSNRELGFTVEENLFNCFGEEKRKNRVSSGPACRGIKLGPNQTKWSGCGLLPGSVHTYRVVAFNQCYRSKNNPTVSVTLPDLDRIGQEISLPEMLGYFSEESLFWNGKEWVLTWASDRDDPERVKRAYPQYQIYFQIFDENFRALSQVVRVSQSPGITDNPSLAWTGSEYGVVWMDSRNCVYDCDGSEGCKMCRNLYFIRLSKQGRVLESEIPITQERFYWEYPKLFWREDHYDLFWHGNGRIFFVRLNQRGEKLEQPRSITPPFNPYTGFWAVQARDSFGLTWTSRGEPNYHLYFLAFNPEDPSEQAPIELSKEGIPRYASMFWTGSEYGVCWDDGKVNVSLIPAHSLSSIKTIDLESFRVPCSSSDASPQPEHAFIYNNLIVPDCVWTGSEIGMVARPVLPNDVREISLIRLSLDGRLLDEEKYLGESKKSYSYTYPSIDWNGSAYFSYIGGESDSMIVVEQAESE